MIDVLIRGGRVVTPDGVANWDVAIQGERIVAVAAPGALTDEVRRVIDATGKLVIPGGIDPHVHTYFPMMRGREVREFAAGDVYYTAPPGPISRAALFGGTTTIADFAIWKPGITLAQAIAERQEIWKEAYTDYSFHVSVQGAVPPEVIDEVPDAISAGFPSFKIYTTNSRPNQKNRKVGMGHAWALLQKLARHGGILAVHAEDDDIVMYMYEKLEREGKMGLENLPLIHSAMSEDLSFRRIIHVARYVEGAVLYMMHVSAKQGVDAVAEARAAGYPIYAETLHHYASFTADYYLRPDGALFHTYPSVKYEEDRARIWEGLRSGILSTVATDEVCTPRAVKMEDQTMLNTTGGHVGVETRIGIIYTEGVSKRGLPLERWVELTSTDAAKLLGMYPRKGAIAAGSDADIVVFDPTVRKALRLDDLHGSDYSIWEGWEVHGWPSLTMLRGQVVVEGGQLTAEAGIGHQVPRKLVSAVQSGPAF